MVIATRLPTSERVRMAGVDDAERVADTLGSAFREDPVMSWCFPDPDRRRRTLPGLFRAIVTAALPHGGVDTVPGEHAGAVWVPPDAELDDGQLAADLLEVAGDDAERIVTLMEVVDVEHPTDGAHQYLSVLGTRPEWQSHGLGSALLRSVLDRCDIDGTPAYLEATSKRSRQLYLHHGFEVRTTVRLPDGPPLWCMWREPQR